MSTSFDVLRCGGGARHLKAKDNHRTFQPESRLMLHLITLYFVFNTLLSFLQNDDCLNSFRTSLVYRHRVENPMTSKQQQWTLDTIKKIVASDMIFFDISINTAQICMVFFSENC